MKKAALALAIVLGVSLVVMSCALGPGSANASRVVTGTITVPTQPDWADVVIGVFSGGNAGAGTYPALGTHDDLANSGKYRVTYDSGGSGDVEIVPVAGSTYSISDMTGTSSAYTFELPATVPKILSSSSKEAYYYAAWLDTHTVNGHLDLKDANDFTDQVTTALGEFNRCAMKATYDNNNAPTTIVIDRFTQSVDFSQNPTGNYKYNGYDHSAYNEIVDVTTDSNSGFNFNISATSGW